MIDYDRITEKVKKEAPLQKGIDDIILMDVSRSFTSNKDIKPAALINILRTYAYYNPEVEYCQGMNFIVGYLYLLLQDEGAAFKFLKAIIERYSMDQLFTENVPLLKKYFYQMDRLMSFHFPQLTAHFRNEGVSASFFTSAWFITLFTYSLQFAKEGRPSETLLAMWDAFLLWGWKAIFKSGMFIIGAMEGRLLESRFDQIMMTLGELPKSKFMQDPETAGLFCERFRNIKVTNGLLEELSTEYIKTISQMKVMLAEQQSEESNGSEASGTGKEGDQNVQHV